MLAEIGYGILVVAFVAASIASRRPSMVSGQRSAAIVELARRAMLLLWPLISLGAGV